LGCGGGGGGGEKAPSPDIHEGEVLIEFFNYCDDEISQVWYCPCPPPEYPIPTDSWIRVNLPSRLERHATVLFDWIPIGAYAFLWRTAEGWDNRNEPIPENLPSPPFQWSTWNARQCLDIYPVIASDGLSDHKDLCSVGLSCPGYH